MRQPATIAAQAGTAHLEPAVRLDGFVKRIREPLTGRSRTIVSGIDLAIQRGEVFGLLGLNGAGKTTILQALVGLSAPTRGTVSVCGADPRDPATRRRVGFLPERPSFYDFLTPLEFLDMAGRLSEMSSDYRKRRIGELVAFLGLEGCARTPLRKLSKGELQRVGIAQAVLHEPELVILDEPMSGLDPLGRRDVRDLVETLRKRGHTIVFSSHIVPDVETLCDRVGVLHQGRLLSVGRIEDITAVRLQGIDVIVRDVPGDLLERLSGLADEFETTGTTTRVRIKDPERVDRLVVRILQAGGRLQALERRRERLEDYLLRVTSNGEEVT